MTDSGNTGIAPKNDGGDYPARPPTEAVKGIFVHYGGRRFFFGRKSETGRSLRRFFRVPVDETLYRENPGCEPNPLLIIDDETAHPLADGQRYFSEPIPVPPPELKPIEKGDLPAPVVQPTMAAECGAAEFAPRIGSPEAKGESCFCSDAPADGEPMPPWADALIRTLDALKAAAVNAADEAKRARTLAEENEALGRKNREDIHRAVDAATAAHEQAKTNGATLSRLEQQVADLKAGLLALAGEIGDRIPYRPPTPAEKSAAAAVRAAIDRRFPASL